MEWNKFIKSKSANLPDHTILALVLVRKSIYDRWVTDNIEDPNSSVVFLITMHCMPWHMLYDYDGGRWQYMEQVWVHSTIPIYYRACGHEHYPLTIVDRKLIDGAIKLYLTEKSGT